MAQRGDVIVGSGDSIAWRCDVIPRRGDITGAVTSSPVAVVALGAVTSSCGAWLSSPGALKPGLRAVTSSLGAVLPSLPAAMLGAATSLGLREAARRRCDVVGML